MQNFRDICDTWKRSFVSAFSISITVPLSFYNKVYPREKA